MAKGNNNQKNPHLRQRLKQEKHQEHREEREQKERERFTQSPTGRQARHQAHAYANQEYNPTIRGIREEEASLGKQAQQANQWYNQLAGEQTQAAQAQEAGANSFSSSLTQQLASANAQNASYLASQQAAQQQQAALTGQPLIASSGEAAAAGANMGALQGIALNAPVQQQAHSQAALTRRLGIASREQGHATQQGILGERKKVRQDLRAAQKQKGQAYVGRLGELRESARKQELDAKAFELEGQQTALQAQQEREKLRQDEIQSKRSAQTSRQNSERTAASSAASTAASQTSAEASAKNARIAEEKFQAEQRYKRNHHGMTPAEVAARQKENRPSLAERRDKKEERHNAYVAASTAARAYIEQNGGSAKTFTPKEWHLLEQHLTETKSHGGADLSPAAAAEAIKILKKQSGWTVEADPNEASLGR